MVAAQAVALGRTVLTGKKGLGIFRRTEGSAQRGSWRWSLCLAAHFHSALKLSLLSAHLQGLLGSRTLFLSTVLVPVAGDTILNTDQQGMARVFVL